MSTPILSISHPCPKQTHTSACTHTHTHPHDWNTPPILTSQRHTQILKHPILTPSLRSPLPTHTCIYIPSTGTCPESLRRYTDFTPRCKCRPHIPNTPRCLYPSHTPKKHPHTRPTSPPTHTHTLPPSTHSPQPTATSPHTILRAVFEYDLTQMYTKSPERPTGSGTRTGDPLSGMRPSPTVSPGLRPSAPAHMVSLALCKEPQHGRPQTHGGI